MLRATVGLMLVIGIGVSSALVPQGAAGAGPPTITATPASALVDGQTVRIDGAGFAADTHYEIFECAGDSVDEQRCDPRNAFEVDSDPSGHVRFDFAVDARIYLGPTGTTSYDCRTAPAGCRIGVGLIVEHANSAFVMLQFLRNAPLLPPVSATVSPATGLVDGQSVTVHGAHLSAREAGWVMQCKTGGAPRACDLDDAVQLQPAADGTLTTTLRVHAAFRSPLGDDVDCRPSPGACSVGVSWGFAFVADRFAEVHVTFGSPAPTTTTATTTATTAPSESTVSAATTAPVSAATLPRTGAARGASSGLAWLGALLVALGALGVVLGRRRVRLATGSPTRR